MVIQIGQEQPFHRFYFVSKLDYSYHEHYMVFRDKVTPNILIAYNVLGWISYKSPYQWLSVPTYNPSKEEYETGLYPYGPNILNHIGANIVVNIFNDWIDRHKNSPQQVQILTPYSDVSDPTTWIIFDRDSFITGFSSMADYLERSLVDNNLYVLHAGI